VEASEAIRRIFWRHRWLLLILVIVPAAAVVAMREHQPVTYTATANVQGQGITPDTSTQVSAIQSRVTAVATDPAVVQQAITAAGVKRDASQVARHEVSVTPLGTSAVMALTITDHSQPVALRLAGALAGVVVNQLDLLGIKDNPELSALNSSIVQLTAKRNTLVAELDSVTAAGVSSTSVQAQSLLSRLSAAEQELATNEATSQQILTSLSANTGASVVSTPSTASEASRNAVTYGALAALLGLVIGLLFGALREIVRPTVAQPAMGARELGAIPLGDAELSGDRVTGIDDDLTGRLSLAAHRAGVHTIVLTGPVSRTRLAALAGRLNTELAAAQPGRPGDPDGWLRTPVLVQASDPPQSSSDAVSQSAAVGQNDGPRYPADTANDGRTGVRAGHPTGIQGSRPRLTVVALPDIRLGDRPLDAALVLALPKFAPHSSLDQAADLCAATDWPILGAIGLRHRGWYAAKSAASPKARNAESGMDGASDDTVEMEQPYD
jgi:hypothetical protein